MLKIHSLETFGTLDGPGIRFIIFTQGCNFMCKYCENADTIPTKGGTKINNNKIVKKLLRQKSYFGKKGGITISGGEPLLQTKGIISLFKKLKKYGINTCIDTNGSILNKDIKKLIKYTDLFIIDIKHFDDEIHKNLIGNSNKNVFKFIDYLNSINKKMRLRHVYVPGYSNKKNNITNIAKYISSKNNIERFEILAYHELGKSKRKKIGIKYPLEGTPIPNKKQLSKAKNTLSKYNPKKQIIIK